LRGQGSSVSYSEVSWSSLKQLLPYLLKYRLRLGLSLLCLILAKLASISLPFLLKDAVDQLDSAGDVGSIIAVPLGLLLAYAIVRFANVLFAELRDTVFGRVSESAMHNIGLKVFKHLHSLDLQFHLNRKTGALSRDIERGTNGISFLLRFMVFNIIPTLLEIILVIVILSSRYTLWFGLIVFVAIVIYITYSIYATEIRTKHVREMNTADSDASTRAIDSLLNYETVKYFGNEDYEAKLYDENLTRWQSARRKNRLTVFTLNGGQAFIISLAMGLSMILAAYGVQRGEMTLGDFVLINAFMMQIFMPLNFLGFVYREMKGSMANIENLFKLLRENPSIKNSDSATELALSQAEIQFDDVSFSYQKERNILNKISFTLPAKSRLAIVGHSGSGKSTISKLLFRFYDPTGGVIRIDGQDIHGLSLESLRASMAFVPQDTVLFNTTIYENIRYGDIDAEDSAIQQAIDMADLRNFINKLPLGLDTVVGERGLKLSGGEKQRIAIARAILKKPAILVFDEATSSLDSKAEKEILNAIDSISGDRSVLMIAHRLSTIASADQILVLDDGNIVERGNHQELIAKKGTYAELWELQKKEEVDA
jgi:ABC-type transport system involved in Fe-S cluster assembly fused permease/ATPase subunit